MVSREFFPLFNENNIYVEQDKSVPSFYKFYFTVDSTQDKDPIRIIQNDEIFRILEESNPDNLKILGYDEILINNICEKIVIIEVQVYESNNSDSDSDSDSDEHIFIINAPNNIIIVDDNYVKIKYIQDIVREKNDITCSIECIKNDVSICTVSLFVKLNTSVSIIKENIFIDSIKRIMYNCKQYLTNNK